MSDEWFYCVCSAKAEVDVNSVSCALEKAGLEIGECALLTACVPEESPPCVVVKCLSPTALCKAIKALESLCSVTIHSVDSFWEITVDTADDYSAQDVANLLGSDGIILPAVIQASPTAFHCFSTSSSWSSEPEDCESFNCNQIRIVFMGHNNESHSDGMLNQIQPVPDGVIAASAEEVFELPATSQPPQVCLHKEPLLVRELARHALDPLLGRWKEFRVQLRSDADRSELALALKAVQLTSAEGSNFLEIVCVATTSADVYNFCSIVSQRRVAAVKGTYCNKAKKELGEILTPDFREFTALSQESAQRFFEFEKKRISGIWIDALSCAFDPLLCECQVAQVEAQFEEAKGKETNLRDLDLRCAEAARTIRALKENFPTAACKVKCDEAVLWLFDEMRAIKEKHTNFIVDHCAADEGEEFKRQVLKAVDAPRQNTSGTRIDIEVADGKGTQTGPEPSLPNAEALPWKNLWKTINRLKKQLGNENTKTRFVTEFRGHFCNHQVQCLRLFNIQEVVALYLDERANLVHKAEEFAKQRLLDFCRWVLSRLLTWNRRDTVLESIVSILLNYQKVHELPTASIQSQVEEEIVRALLPVIPLKVVAQVKRNSAQLQDECMFDVGHIKVLFLNCVANAAQQLQDSLNETDYQIEVAQTSKKELKEHMATWCSTHSSLVENKGNWIHVSLTDKVQFANLCCALKSMPAHACDVKYFVPCRAGSGMMVVLRKSGRPSSTEMLEDFVACVGAHTNENPKIQMCLGSESCLFVLLSDLLENAPQTPERYKIHSRTIEGEVVYFFLLKPPAEPWICEKEIQTIPQYTAYLWNCCLESLNGVQVNDTMTLSGIREQLHEVLQSELSHSGTSVSSATAVEAVNNTLCGIVMSLADGIRKTVSNVVVDGVVQKKVKVFGTVADVAFNSVNFDKMRSVAEAVAEATGSLRREVVNCIRKNIADNEMCKAISAHTFSWGFRDNGALKDLITKELKERSDALGILDLKKKVWNLLIEPCRPTTASSSNSLDLSFPQEAAQLSGDLVVGARACNRLQEFILRHDLPRVIFPAASEPQTLVQAQQKAARCLKVTVHSYAQVVETFLSAPIWEHRAGENFFLKRDALPHFFRYLECSQLEFEAQVSFSLTALNLFSMEEAQQIAIRLQRAKIFVVGVCGRQWEVVAKVREFENADLLGFSLKGQDLRRITFQSADPHASKFGEFQCCGLNDYVVDSNMLPPSSSALILLRDKGKPLFPKGVQYGAVWPGEESIKFAEALCFPRITEEPQWDHELCLHYLNLPGNANSVRVCVAAHTQYISSVSVRRYKLKSRRTLVVLPFAPFMHDSEEWCNKNEVQSPSDCQKPFPETRVECVDDPWQRVTLGQEKIENHQICVVHVANSEMLGGGWIKGDPGNEAELLRRSDLFESFLMSGNFPLSPFSVTETNNVTIFRAGAHRGYELLPMEGLTTVTVLSIPQLASRFIPHAAQVLLNILLRAQRLKAQILVIDPCLGGGITHEDASELLKEFLPSFAGCFKKVFIASSDESYLAKLNAVLPKETESKVLGQFLFGFGQEWECRECPQKDCCTDSEVHRFLWWHQPPCLKERCEALFAANPSEEMKQHLRKYSHREKCDKDCGVRKLHHYHPPLCERDESCTQGNNHKDNPWQICYSHKTSPCPEGNSCRQLRNEEHMKNFFHDCLPLCSRLVSCPLMGEEEHIKNFSHICSAGPNCPEKEEYEHQKRFFHLNKPKCTNCEHVDEEHFDIFQHAGAPFRRLQCEDGTACTKQHCRDHIQHYYHPYSQPPPSEIFGNNFYFKLFEKETVAKVTNFEDNVSQLIKAIDYYNKSNNQKFDPETVEKVEEQINKFRFVHRCNVDTFRRICNSMSLSSLYLLRRSSVSESALLVHTKIVDLLNSNISDAARRLLSAIAKRGQIELLNPTSIRNVARQVESQETEIEHWVAVVNKERGGRIGSQVKEAAEAYLASVKEVQELPKKKEKIGTENFNNEAVETDRTIFAIFGPHTQNYGGCNHEGVHLVLSRDALLHPDSYICPILANTSQQHYDSSLRPWVGTKSDDFTRIQNQKLHPTTQLCFKALAMDLIGRTALHKKKILEAVTVDDVFGEDGFWWQRPSLVIEGHLPCVLPLSFVEKVFISEETALELDKVGEFFGSKLVKVPLAETVTQAQCQYVLNAPPLNLPSSYDFTLALMARPRPLPWDVNFANSFSLWFHTPDNHGSFRIFFSKADSDLSSAYSFTITDECVTVSTTHCETKIHTEEKYEYLRDVDRDRPVGFRFSCNRDESRRAQLELRCTGAAALFTNLGAAYPLIDEANDVKYIYVQVLSQTPVNFKNVHLQKVDPSLKEGEKADFCFQAATKTKREEAAPKPSFTPKEREIIQMCDNPFDCQFVIQYPRLEDRHAVAHFQQCRHMCENGQICPDVNDYSHSCQYFHEVRKPCLEGSQCPQLTDPRHRRIFFHKGAASFMIRCPNMGNCCDESFDHQVKFHHDPTFDNMSFELPQNDLPRRPWRFNEDVLRRSAVKHTLLSRDEKRPLGALLRCVAETPLAHSQAVERESFDSSRDIFLRLIRLMNAGESTEGLSALVHELQCSLNPAVRDPTSVSETLEALLEKIEWRDPLHRNIIIDFSVNCPNCNQQSFERFAGAILTPPSSSISKYLLPESIVSCADCGNDAVRRVALPNQPSMVIVSTQHGCKQHTHTDFAKVQQIGAASYTLVGTVVEEVNGDEVYFSAVARSVDGLYYQYHNPCPTFAGYVNFVDSVLLFYVKTDMIDIVE